MLKNDDYSEPAVGVAQMATVTRPIALVGLHYLPYCHTLYMLYVNITPHVCKGLKAIWAYIACALLAPLA